MDFPNAETGGPPGVNVCPAMTKLPSEFSDMTVEPMGSNNGGGRSLGFAGACTRLTVIPLMIAAAFEGGKYKLFPNALIGGPPGASV